MKPFRNTLRVYYKDTDCGGVVYYANYLRYFEVARTEFLESKGVSMRTLMDEGVYFVVKEAHLDYKSPGRYGDILLIETVVKQTGRTYIVFGHEVKRQDTEEVLVTAEVKIVAVSSNLRPVRIPEKIKEAISPEFDV